MAADGAISRVAGIVLCGGASRRMGRSKADLPFGPETLIVRAVRQLAEALDPVVVAAAPGQGLPDFTPLRTRIVRDEAPHQGPLHGLAAALAELSSRSEFAYLAAVDAPWFSPEWVRLLTTRIEGCDAAAAVVDGRLQPFAALYRVATAREAIDRLLLEGGDRLSTLLERLKTRQISGPELIAIDPNGSIFRDMDRPEDYGRMLAEAAGNRRI